MHPTRPNIYTPGGGPPQVQRPSPEIYAAMGEAGVFRMIEDFYRELERSEIRHLFPDDMVEASRKSAAFFVGLLGGPPLYQQRYGSPMLRARHIPFPIDEHARRVWLGCFRRVLDNAEEVYAFPAQHKAGFIEFLDVFSGWMVNLPPDDHNSPGAEAGGDPAPPR